MVILSYVQCEGVTLYDHINYLYNDLLYITMEIISKKEGVPEEKKKEINLLELLVEALKTRKKSERNKLVEVVD